ncbi:hypothetical protein CRENBAI_014250 [Crenichthys baileyi]|uniref:Uncharacterized protein n=1 Tax=Crenichthys baileyi TaxID=28760 RepID=A0AAV9R683_9TELE
MRPPRHVLHSGPTSKPSTLTENLRRAAERSARQAREAVERRSPFWGSRLAIPLPVTGPRRYTPSLSSQHISTVRQTAPSSSLEPMLGAAHFLCLVWDSSTAPLQSSCTPSDSELPVCSSSCHRYRRRQDIVPPVLEVRTGASLSFLGGLASAPSPCPAHFLVSSLVPAITQWLPAEE